MHLLVASTEQGTQFRDRSLGLDQLTHTLLGGGNFQTLLQDLLRQLIGDDAHAGIIGHHQVAGLDQLAAQGDGAVHLHTLHTVFTGNLSGTTGEDGIIILTDRGDIATASVYNVAGKATALANGAALTSHVGDIQVSTEVGNQDIAGLTDVVDVTGGHGDEVVIVDTLGGGLADRDVTYCHSGATVLAAGDDGFQIRCGNGAVNAVAVQNIGNSGGHILHRQITIDDLLGNTWKLDLADTLTGNQPQMRPAASYSA